jgi:hypothetical protein
MRGDYHWPADISVSKNLKNLVAALFEHDPIERLGSIDDAEELMDHPWLSHIDWDKMEARQYLVSIDLCPQ